MDVDGGCWWVEDENCGWVRVGGGNGGWVKVGEEDDGWVGWFRGRR